MKKFLLFFVALLVSAAFSLTSGQSTGGTSSHLDYLHFTALNGGGTVSLGPKYGSTGGQDLHCSFQYSVDDCATWINYQLDSIITLSSGDTVYFKATTTNQTLAVDDQSYHQFAMTGTIEAHGNVMSLLDATLTRTSVPDWCFVALFKYCSSLITPPYLPATQLSIYSYESMFARCYNLAYPPVLPATYVPTYCYDNMFSRCYMISMNISGPGYAWGFPSGATSAKTWAADMFYGTRGTMNGTPNINQTYYYQLPGYTIDVNANDSFMGSVTGGGTYNLYDTVTLTATPVANHHFVNWSNGDTTSTIKMVAAGNTTLTANFAVNPEYLHFTAVDDSATVSLDTVGGSAPTISLQYSTDHCSTWNSYSPTQTIGLSQGETLYLKATTTNGAFSSGSNLNDSRYRFSMTGTIEAYGNVMSLLDATLAQTSVPANAFYGLFEDCASMVTAPSLPATQLGVCCYLWMFLNCTGLTEAPELPATTMLKACYADMFKGCTSLVSAPVLNSTSLAEGCYTEMFQKCTSLTEAPLLPATSAAKDCYHLMFDSCVSLTFPPVLPATTLANNCYEGMFRNCTSISLYEVGLGRTWNIPSGATSASNWGKDMFLGTGGSLQGTPVIGQTYYEEPLYTVTVLADDATKGSVTGGGGLYETNDTVIVTATPNAGYHFAGWSNGVTTPSFGVVVTCDTTVTANFALNPTYLFEEYDTICQGDTLTWRNRTLTVAGVYHDSLRTVAYGADSVYQLTLTVNPTYFVPESAVICQGQTYSWHSRNLTAAGVYYDSLLTVNGCDSVHQLTLTVNPTYFVPESAVICQGQTYSWHSRSLTAAGVYYDSLLTVNGCDSVHQLTLTVNPTYFNTESAVICQGQTYSWHSRNLTAAGVYYDSLLTANGCDSVHQLTLTVNPTYYNTESAVICQGQTYSWHSRNLTAAGVYYDSLLSVNGCDSVHQLTLTVNPTYFFAEADTICQGQTYSWHSRNLTAAGVYYDSLLTVNGCDSVHQLTLTVNPTYFTPESETICNGASYFWHGQMLTEAGVYRDSLLSVEGCDSVFELTLSLWDSYLFAQTDSVCGGTYRWRGRDISAPGVYRDSFLTVHGCDSVYQLTFSVTSQYKFVEHETICQGDTLLWHGRKLHIADIYYDSLVSLSGCDSIYELHLLVNQRYFMPSVQTICQGDTFVWRGQTLTAAGIYSDSLTTVTGCDSIFRLLLTVNRRYLVHDYAYICTGSVYTWHGRVITEPGNYFDTLRTGTGCDSICILTLTQAVSYTFSDSAIICNEPLTWRGQTITTAGTYYDSYVAMTGCDSVYVMKVTFEQFTVTAVAADESMGYVSGSGIYSCGDTATLTALPYQNYEFVSWSNGSTSPTLDITVNQDTALVAYFAIAQGVDNVEALNLQVASQRGSILLRGAEGHGVALYDAVGKMIARIDDASDYETIPVSVAGIYILKVDNGQSLRVIVK